MSNKKYRVVLRQPVISWDGKVSNQAIDCTGWNKHASGVFIVLYNAENRQIHINQNNILSITEIECDGKGQKS